MATDEQLARVRWIRDYWTTTAESREALAAVLEDHARLRKAINDFGNNPNGFDFAVLDRLDQQEAEIARLKDELAGSEVNP